MIFHTSLPFYGNIFHARKTQGLGCEEFCVGSHRPPSTLTKIVIPCNTESKLCGRVNSEEFGGQMKVWE